jgi:hypothetical protein
MSTRQVLVYGLLIVICCAGFCALVAAAESDSLGGVVESELLSLQDPDPATLLVKRPYGYILTTQKDNSALAVYSSNLDKSGSGGAVIRGTVYNASQEEIGVVILVFNLFDASGNQLGNAYASLDFFAGRTTWNFITDPVPYPDIQFYKFAHFFSGSYGKGL